MKRPIIGVTMGDPASIGPEISLKVFGKKDLYKKSRPLLIGDSCVLKKVMTYLPTLKLDVNPISNINQAIFKPGIIDVYDLKEINIKNLKFGRASKQAGNAAFEYVKKDIELANNHQIDATVTNALNKEAINLAGHHFAGHTEIFAKFTHSNHCAMMLAFGNLKVVHVSTHVSLRKACDLVKKPRIQECIYLADEVCRRTGIKNPKVAVAALNPHAGENGLFGSEEIKEIRPAVKCMRAKGMNVVGPLPADTVFAKCAGGMFDIVVAMYHDQGHIPVKMLGFNYNEQKNKWNSVSGINITLGLPIIRTSVDHGTAFDQVLKGTANETSLENAIDYAIKLANEREK